MYPYNNYSQIPDYYNRLATVGYNQPQQLIKVNGIESAKAYQTQPNSTVALFDANDDVMYIKTTDASNFPSIRRFRFIEEPETVTQTQSYVTREEFNQFKEELLNAQHTIQQQTQPDK